MMDSELEWHDADEEEKPVVGVFVLAVAEYGDRGWEMWVCWDGKAWRSEYSLLYWTPAVQIAVERLHTPVPVRYWAYVQTPLIDKRD